MYSQADIEDAVAAGALAPDQAANLRDYVAARNGGSTSDEEYVPFVLGFNDIFVFYACLMALVALGMLGLLAPITSVRAIFPTGTPILSPLLVAGGAWGLSEIFLRRGRFALVGILLAFAVGVGIFLTFVFIMVTMMASAGAASPITLGAMGSCGCFIAAAATYAHWKRFRVPFAVLVYLGLGVLGVIGLIGALLAMNPAGGSILSIVVLLFGVGLFAYAIHVDAQDPRRFTRTSEVGLWVHWLAAGLLSYGLMAQIGAGNGVTSAGTAVGAILIFLLFAAVSLAANRRQLLLAALTPLGNAFGSIFGGSGGRGFMPTPMNPYGGASSPFGGPSSYGGNPYAAPYGRGSGGSDSLATMTGTAFVIALILLGLALFWRPLRAGVLSILPAHWRSRLPAVDQGVVAETYTFQ